MNSNPNLGVPSKTTHSDRRLGPEPQVSRSARHVQDTRDEPDGRARSQRPGHVVPGRQGRVDTVASARSSLRHGHQEDSNGDCAQADGAHAKSGGLALPRPVVGQMCGALLPQQLSVRGLVRVVCQRARRVDAYGGHATRQAARQSNARCCHSSRIHSKV